ncbi:hypothetical protein [Acinetobacter pittii]|uniref:hypothetical protein n=1 Tax=Acinetobacter pittii TaxID=48296 RepID=UPI00148AAD22|nr:hypothetical protein [Acinetobacter pittii]MCK0915104.1 hypothetical protein [Acinetobacter pittii]
MPMQYALAFLSAKAELVELARSKTKPEHERRHNSHANQPSQTKSKTYVSTKRVCS